MAGAGFANDVVYGDNVDFTGTTPTIGRVTANGQLLIGSTAPPNIRVGTLSSSGGTITITNGAGTINLDTTSSGALIWTVITTSQSAVSHNGYFTNGSGLVTVTLPATSLVGDTFAVANMNANGWTIAQNSGQSIQIGADTTTVTTGSLSSTDIGDVVYLVCNVVNTGWFVTSSIGNITVV
jgi:hypothetical protein